MTPGRARLLLGGALGIVSGAALYRGGGILGVISGLVFYLVLWLLFEHLD